MKTLLVITSSMNDIEGIKSASSKAAHAYTEQFQLKYPESTVEFIDLNETQFAEKSLNAKTMATYFEDSEEWINKLKSVEQIVFSTPMTNFGYTSTVKNFIDKIAVAGKSFQYKYDGSGKSEGLINTRIQIITSQGAPKGWYLFGDHTIQLEGTFKFLGMEVAKPIVIAGTKTPENKGKNNNDFVQEITEEIINSIA